MGTFIFLVIFIVVVSIIAVVLADKAPLKDSNGDIYQSFTSGNAFGAIGGNQSVKGVLKDSCLYIYCSYHPDVNVSLPYHKITNVKRTTEIEIKEKSKSVAGRAIAGGMILGPVGALFGGISGIGSKQERNASNYILISYRPTPDDEEYGILLRYSVGATDKFIDTLKERANIIEQKSVEL